MENGKEIFKTKCLPGIKKNTDFNGLGSSNTHLNNKIYLSIGTPEQSSQKIAILAQDKNSMFGKILEIDKNDFGNASQFFQNAYFRNNNFWKKHFFKNGL